MDELLTLIRMAISEDLGTPRRDVTSEVLIAPAATGRAVMRSRRRGVLAGGGILPTIAAEFDPAIRVDILASDGATIDSGSDIATFTGPLRSILAMERTALNFTTHLSGIATEARRYVDAVAGTRAKIYDTRKTIPGLRTLAKMAVRCGGGFNHRMGLHDAVLIKDNHIAAIPLSELTSVLSATIGRARLLTPPPAFVEVEVDTLQQLERVLPCGADVVLLDNMAPAMLRQAVAMRDRLSKAVQLEASGGVNLSSVRAIAESGVDRIAIGAMTHSAPTLDLGLDIDA